MICVEGYKAFKGILRISPKSDVAPFEIYSSWLYRPDTGCWYGCGRSFAEDICTVVCEEAEDV